MDSNDGWSFYDVACALADRLGQAWPVVPTHAFAFDQRMQDARLGVPRLAERLPLSTHRGRVVAGA